MQGSSMIKLEAAHGGLRARDPLQSLVPLQENVWSAKRQISQIYMSQLQEKITHERIARRRTKRDKH